MFIEYIAIEAGSEGALFFFTFLLKEKHQKFKDK